MAITTFDDLMKGFGVVTVMNASIYTLKENKAYSGSRGSGAAGGGLLPTDFMPTGEYLDTLKIANFTQEGPTKTITGGQYANPLIKYGKTMTAEIQDALGSAKTLVRFMGAEYSGEVVKANEKINSNYCVGDGVSKTFAIFNGIFPTAQSFSANTSGIALTDATVSTPEPSYTYDPINCGAIVTFATAPAIDDHFYFVLTAKAEITYPNTRLSITDKFPGPFAIQGDTFFIDQKTGEKKTVYIVIYQFLPDAILTLTQDGEGDATVFDLNGTVSVTSVADGVDKPVRSVFYDILDKPFFN